MAIGRKAHFAVQTRIPNVDTGLGAYPCMAYSKLPRRDTFSGVSVLGRCKRTHLDILTRTQNVTTLTAWDNSPIHDKTRKENLRPHLVLQPSLLLHCNQIEPHARRKEVSAVTSFGPFANIISRLHEARGSCNHIPRTFRKDHIPLCSSLSVI